MKMRRRKSLFFRDGGVIQVAESLLSKSEALSSNTIKRKRKKKTSWVSVAHTCNTSYSGGRDQEDCNSKPALGKQFRELISKNPSQKRGSRCRPRVQAPVPRK
jgi:hypothetical protein